MPGETFTFGSFALIPTARTLLADGRPLRLGSRALDILITLVEKAGETVRKDDLIARAWPDTTVDEASLRINIAALRRTLGDGRGNNRFITNVPGEGYIFVASATRAWRESADVVPARREAVRGNDISASMTRIIGRQAEVAVLVRELARCRLLTIVGAGGVGKTTIAAGIAEAVRDTYADGVWFVALAALQDPELVANAVGTILGVPLLGADPVLELTKWLRDKQTLIVLDNCEHVIDAAASLAEAILKSAPRTSILATSREPLRVEGESRHRLAPLKYPRRANDVAASEALTYPAVQLFNERAAAAADDFAIDDADVPTVVEICRRLDGVPLALELAAAHVAVFGVRRLADRLDDRFGLLIHGRRTAMARHQTLRATMDWSHNLLPIPEQIIFRRLAIFQGDFTLDAASAVTGGDAQDAHQALTLVANLVDKSLVAADISSDVTYYRLLETARAYAMERLSASGEHERVAKQHAQFFHHLVARADGGAVSGSGIEWRGERVRLIDNLRAALDWAFSGNGDVDIGIRLTADMITLWVEMSLMSECRRYVELALAAMGAGANRDARIEMVLSAAHGVSLTYTTKPGPGTVAAWSRTLQLAEQLGDTEYRLQALRGLWAYRMNGGDYRAALTLADEFSSLAERLAEPHTVRAGDRMAGLILHYLGEQADARKRIEWSLGGPVPVAQPVPGTRFLIDQGVAARALFARILWLQGFPDQATRVAASAVQRAEAADHVISRCHALAQAACPVSLYVGDFASADGFVSTLVELASHNGLEGWIARGKCFGGVAQLQRGQIADGLAVLRRAIGDLRAVGSLAEYPAFVGALALGLGIAGQFEEARAAIEEAIGWSDSTGERWCAAELLRIKGDILLLPDTPDATAAEIEFRRSLDVARQQGALSWELRTATGLARLMRDRGQRREARAVLAPLYIRFREGFATADLRTARLLLDDLT